MKVYNLTTEKCASRSVGAAIEVILGYKYLKSYPENHSRIFPKVIPSYHNFTKDEWVNFDKLCDDNYVFQFVRNPFDRFVSSFIMAYGGDEGYDFIGPNITLYFTIIFNYFVLKIFVKEYLIVLMMEIIV